MFDSSSLCVGPSRGGCLVVCPLHCMLFKAKNFPMLLIMLIFDHDHQNQGENMHFLGVSVCLY